MRRSSFLLTSLALSSPFALAQTSAPAPPHRTTPGTAHRTTAHTPARPAAPACATLPSISPKIPALPTGVSCPKPLFTVSDRLDYISPLAERFRSTLFAELPVVISLVYADIVPGNGALAKPQQFYTVKYTGYLTDGTKFDSSYDHPETKDAGFSFPYGAHRVIAGWDMGFEGMHIGGKRRLYIPYQFAYGAAGHPPSIPAKSMLVFDMELIAQNDQAPTPPAPSTPPTTPGAPSGGVTGNPATTPSTPASPGSAPATPTSPNPQPNTQPNTQPSTQPAPPAPGTPTTPPPSPGDKPAPPKPGTPPPSSTPPSATQKP